MRSQAEPVRSDGRTFTSGNGVVPVDVAVREGGHVVEMQHRRVLTATVELVLERGAQALTVATVCERAGLSRRTFYEIFTDREECLLATFEDAVERVTRTVQQAVAGEKQWHKRMRAGLTSLLSFFDHDPGTGRLLVVDALSSGDRTLQARARVLAQVIAIVEEGRKQAKGREPPPLTAEGVVGAVLSVIHARMLAAPRVGGRDAGSLIELSGPLMAMIVQPYLGSAVAQRELERPATVEQPPVPRLPADPFRDLSMRLTYRTARVLCSIAATPGSSSKQIARAAGITDEGQASKLLTRLQRYGLIRDTGVGPAKGMPRAWLLTERGEGVLQAVGVG